MGLGLPLSGRPARTFISLSPPMSGGWRSPATNLARRSSTPLSATRCTGHAGEIHFRMGRGHTSLVGGRVVKTGDNNPPDWSAQGHAIVYEVFNDRTQNDLWPLSLS